MIRDLRSFPNQLTLLRLMFIPFIVIQIVDGSYDWAFALFLAAGISDGLDGVLARALKQKTLLGQYLDPIADKLLLSTLFVVLSLMHKIPWKVTVLVFSRDLLIVTVCAVLYATVHMRDFGPSIFGKMNTLAQIVTVTAVLYFEASGAEWAGMVARAGFWSTITFTVVSGLHYVYVIGNRIRALPSPPAVS